MSRKRKHLDDELLPTVKLISEGDLLVERLLEKQLSKQSTLHTELQRKQIFVSSTEYKPISDYVSGINSLNQLENTSEYIRKLEEFTAAGLCKEDLHLFLDREKGLEYLKNKHKNLDPQLVEKKLLTINKILSKYQESNSVEKTSHTGSRLHSECMLSIKPNSIETNLLKFALNNERKIDKSGTEVEPIKDIEKNFMNSLNDALDENVNITKLQKKVQRRLRAISNKIDSMTTPTEQTKFQNSTSCTVNNSKWDKKHDETNSINTAQNISANNIQQISKTRVVQSDTKILGSSLPKGEISGNRYTIRDGTIIKLENLIDYTTCRKLTMEEIINIPKFAQYNPGQPSRILYLKNVHSLCGIDLKLLFKAFNFQTKAIKVMKGRMKGQALIEMENSEVAEQALTRLNGIIVKDKPVIIQFSSRSELT